MAGFLIGLSAGVIVVIGALAVQRWRNAEYTRKLSRLYLMLMSFGLVIYDGVIEDAFDIFPPLGLPEWVGDVALGVTLAFLVLMVYVWLHIRRDNANPASETSQ